MSEEHPATHPFWPRNLLNNCLNVQRGERLLLVTDEPLDFARNALLAEAVAVQPGELWSFTIPGAARPLTSLPARLLDLSKAVDVIIALLAEFRAEEQVSPTLLADLLALYTGGARVAVGGFITRDILEHELSTDYHQVAAFSTALADHLEGSSSIHLTTQLGTDLRLSAASRAWQRDTGLLHSPGWGNVPAGEVFVAPVEESAEGVLVIDKSLPGLALSEPVRIVFEHGRIASIDGSPGGIYLEQALAGVEGEPNGAWARVIGEFGIGTNPKARLLGNIMTDEKVLGTVHIALGRNDLWGGRNVAPIHLDGVVGQPTVRVDGELLIDDGRFVVEV